VVIASKHQAEFVTFLMCFELFLATGLTQNLLVFHRFFAKLPDKIGEVVVARFAPRAADDQELIPHEVLPEFAQVLSFFVFPRQPVRNVVFYALNRHSGTAARKRQQKTDDAENQYRVGGEKR